MDPVTHTLTGAALAAAGWRRRVALATPAAIVAANAPDSDIVSYFHGEYAALAFRRGWTHGPLGMLALAVTMLLLLLAWDRVVRRRREPAAVPARAGPLFLLLLIALLTHPLLDWLNTYGIRWLVPFDRRWYYGDSLFIIDPWIWLLLGVPLFLIHSSSRAGVAAWAVLALMGTAIVVVTGMVPVAAQLIWIGTLLAAAAVRATRGAVVRRAVPLAAGALGAGALYIAGMVAADAAASRQVAAHALAYGIEPRRVMVAPLPAQPLRSTIVIDDGSAYWLGGFDWAASPRVALDPRPMRAGDLDDAITRAAADAPEARDFLRWSRFPLVAVSPRADGYLVHFRDARYLTRVGASSLSGVTVRLDDGLRPLSRADRQ